MEKTQDEIIEILKKCREEILLKIKLREEFSREKFLAKFNLSKGDEVIVNALIDKGFHMA